MVFRRENKPQKDQAECDSVTPSNTYRHQTNSQITSKETSQGMRSWEGAVLTDASRADSGPLDSAVLPGLIVATSRAPADRREVGVRDHSNSVLSHPSPRDAH